MKRKTTFGVIGAMDSEVSKLHGTLRGCEMTEYAGLTFYSGTLGENAVVLVKSGVGKVNAARCAQILIDRFTPDCLINTGIAGGIGEGLCVADLVIGTELVQHDFDVTAFGRVKGSLFAEGDPTQPTVFRSDETLAHAFRRAAARLIDPARIKTGRIATGDQFIAANEKKREIAAEMKALAAEMEGCAVAQTAAASGVPFIVIRAISDLADGTSPGSFGEFEQQTADLSAAVLEEMIRNFTTEEQ